MSDQPDAAEPIQPQSTPITEAVELAAETLGRDLLEALVMELQAAPDCWEKMNQLQQDQAIERLRKRTRTLVAQALHCVFAGQYPALPATLVGVTFKKGIKATLQIGRGAYGRHELADAEGQQVLIVMANPDDYTARMDEIRARDKQGDLFTGNSGISETENYTGGDGRPFRRDEPGISSEESEPPYTGDIDPPDPGDLTLEPDPLWMQASKALEAIDVIVTDEEAQSWTTDQCTAAMFWCQKMVEDPGNGPLRPKFIHAPPPSGDDVH